MTRHHINKTRILVAVLGLMATSVATAGTFDYMVNLDTSSLVGLGPFSLAFQLTDGSGLGDGNNTLNLYSFDFGGGSTGAAADALFGGAAGDLLGGVVITDSDAFFNAMLQSFTPGATLSFHAHFTNNADAGPFQDQFSLSLLDSSLNGVPTLDPSGNDTVLTVGLGTNLTVGTFASDPNRTALVVPAAVATEVPEPGGLLLFGVSFAMLLLLPKCRPV